MMEKYQGDMIVAGSGFGAAVPALRFAENGLKVNMIEKGPPINPYRDFQQTQDLKYLLTYLKKVQEPFVQLNHIEAKGGGSGFYEYVSLRTPSLVFGKTEKKHSTLDRGN